MSTFFSGSRNISQALQGVRRFSSKTKKGGDPSKTLIENNTTVDLSGDMPRVQYRPGISMKERLMTIRAMLAQDKKSLPVHISKMLNGCERLMSEMHEVMSNKIPVPKLAPEEIQSLVKDYYGTGAERKQKVLHIVIGPPGSGKSSRMVEPLQEKYGAMVIDSDHIKPKIPHFVSGFGGVATHEPSFKVALNVLEQAFKNGDNIVYPTTGGNLARMEEFIADARSHGYKVGLHLVDLPVKEAVQRTTERAAIRGKDWHIQYVSPDYVVDCVGNKPKEVFNEIIKRNLVDEYSHISTSNLKKGQKAPVIKESAQKISDLLQNEPK